MKTNFSDDSDIELWQKFRDGSEAAYTAIYERFAPILFRYGYRWLADEDLVKDCIQDLFVHLWQSRRNLGATDSIRFYLFRSLRREIVHKVNSRKREGSVAESFTEEEASFEEEWIKSEEEQRRNTALSETFVHLSPRQREIIFFRFFEDMSFEEISRLMEITPRAAYKLVYRALDSIRDVLDLKVIKK